MSVLGLCHPVRFVLWSAARWLGLVVVAFGFEDVDAERGQVCMASNFACEWSRWPFSSFYTCSFLYHVSSDLHLSVEPVW